MLCLELCFGMILPELCHRNPRVNFTTQHPSYDPSLPPPMLNPKSPSPIRVLLQHRVRDVIKVNDKERTVSIQVVSYKMWKDPRIKVSGEPFESPFQLIR